MSTLLTFNPGLSPDWGVDTRYLQGARFDWVVGGDSVDLNQLTTHPQTRFLVVDNNENRAVWSIDLSSAPFSFHRLVEGLGGRDSASPLTANIVYDLYVACSLYGERGGLLGVLTGQVPVLPAGMVWRSIAPIGITRTSTTSVLSNLIDSQDGWFEYQSAVPRVSDGKLLVSTLVSASTVLSAHANRIRVDWRAEDTNAQVNNLYIQNGDATYNYVQVLGIGGNASRTHAEGSLEFSKLAFTSLNMFRYYWDLLPSVGLNVFFRGQRIRTS